jgi:hypothetical protein
MSGVNETQDQPLPRVSLQFRLKDLRHDDIVLNTFFNVRSTLMAESSIAIDRLAKRHSMRWPWFQPEVGYQQSELKT